jgi:hypothetical protein
MNKTGVNNAISHPFEPAAGTHGSDLWQKLDPMKSRFCSVPDEVARGHFDRVL